MRPRQRNIPRWASKSRRAGKRFPVFGRIQLHPQCSEPLWEVSVELGASNSRENGQDIESQKLKVIVEADSPLPWTEVYCPNGSKYQTREEEEDACHSEREGDLHPRLVTENIIHLQDSQEVHSSHHKRQLPLDSSNTSSSTKRPCPEGRLSSASSSHKESSELAVLRQEVSTLHTRLDIMTSAMNALYKYTQTLHQILEAQAKEGRGQTQKEQPVCPLPDHFYSQLPASPLRILNYLLPQRDLVEDPYSLPYSPLPLYPTEWLERLGTHRQSTPEFRS